MPFHQSMTVQALAMRADEADDNVGTVASWNGSDDERSITAFFAWDDVELDDPNPDAWSVPGYQRRLIGIALDDAETLTREETRDFLGDAVVTRWEGQAFEVAA